jgi:hypothetical protein
MFALTKLTRVKVAVVTRRADPLPDGRRGPSLTLLAVVVGLVLRAWHYGCNHTIWYDESVLLNNVLGKGYLRLLGPLDHAVAAPPLFLWMLKTLHVLVGDVSFVWRLPPFLFSCGTLLLTVPLARLAFAPVLVPVAVGLVAVSDNHVWLGCTVKPYAGDCFLVTLLLYGYLRTADWSAARRLRALAVVSPFLLCFSYPTAFVLGGLMAALLPAAWRSARFAWLSAAGSMLATAMLLYIGPISNQRVTSLVTEWVRDFPNFAKPATVPAWLVEHTATTFQYAFLPAGLVLFALAPVGVAFAWRTGRRDLAVAVTVPFALAVVGAAAHSYPYGFNRLMHFIAPCALMLGGLGLSAVVRRYPRDGVRVAWLLVLVAVVPTVIHLAKPWPRPDSAAVTEFVNKNRLPGEAVFSDEPGYLYFFHGELKNYDELDAVNVGGRVWVVMDHYSPEERRAYVNCFVGEKHGFELTNEWLFRQASAYAFVRVK